MASRVAGKIKLQSVDELLGVPEIAGTQEIEITMHLTTTPQKTRIIRQPLQADIHGCM